jgi:hypothetical protein
LHGFDLGRDFSLHKLVESVKRFFAEDGAEPISRLQDGSVALFL